MPTGDNTEKEAVAVTSAVKDDKAKKNGKGKKDAKAPEELSEEDTALKEGLELAVTRLQEDETTLHEQALNHLVNEIKSSTSSMTAVPKPLKFLRPHYTSLIATYEKWLPSYPLRTNLADVLSVLSMTMAEAGSRQCLKYRLVGSRVDISSWGHEYVRALAGEISEEYNTRSLEVVSENEVDVDDLIELVNVIVPYQMSHNAEAEAVDLLMEVQRLSKLADAGVVDDRNYERVCLYLLRCADYVSDPDDLATLYHTAYEIYKQQGKYCDALRVALRSNDDDKITELFSEELNVSNLIKWQMCHIMGRHKCSFVVEDEFMNGIIGNSNLSERFISTAREMDMMEPKSPEDIYKTHLAEGGGHSRRTASNNATTPVDSARANLASTFVNAFVNAGFGVDKLMTTSDATTSGTNTSTSSSQIGSNNWIFKNKESGMTSAAASLGMVLMWNVDEGLNQIDKYFHNSDDYIKAGACLAMGILSAGVRNESDPTLALLTDYLENPSKHIRRCAICGLGIAYAGARREEISDLLMPLAGDTTDIIESSLAALALGMVFVGTAHDEIGSVLVQRLMESTDDDLNNTMSRFLCLGLGLVYLGKSENADVILEAVRTVEHPRGRYAEVTLDTCSVAGTGNVLKIQSMLKICAEHLTEKAEHQSVAVLGIALTAVGEDVGTEMCLRTFEHLLQYGELPVRRVVPLALALLYISNPDYSIIDQLSRLSHDQDAALSQCAILGLGLVCAGTNNSRVAGLLRQLADFYATQADHLFVVRLAQGLNALGKGLIGIAPFSSDRLLMNGPAMAGLLTVLHASLDIKATILDQYSYILYFLTTAMHPRFLTTVALNEETGQLEPIKTSVRVGLAVETVGLAGKPKTITGFQTHSTPVMLGAKDRAEFANKDFITSTSVLEGVVIVERSPVAVTATEN